jgi:hypothetical protein
MANRLIMANTYNWQVSNMDCYPSAEGETDIVFKAYYYVEAFSSETHEVDNADGSKNTIPYQATTCGEQEFTYTKGAAFTPFSQLTNEMVVGWIQSKLGIDGVNAIISLLDGKIQAQITPPVVNPPLPWA